MPFGRTTLAGAIGAAGLVAFLAKVALGYAIPWSTLDGGGATFSTGGTYSLGGTVGQPDAGACTGGPYALVGGFWGAGLGSPAVAAPLDPSSPTRGALPVAFRLNPSAPNPFVSSTTIAFDLPIDSPVDLRIYDITGRLVRTLESGAQPAGRHRADWSGLDDAGRRVSSGVYFVRMQAGSFRSTHKIVLTH
jgi:hypothetical protein